ncbi:hypothetical protein EDB86DRAFT_2829057 [Lactarius hatsudake]|nr:hypothetical protein EDB86DRAFT_2829057 [Lactarius hatsudake]
MELMLFPSSILSAPSEPVQPLRPFLFHYDLCCLAKSFLSLRLVVTPSTACNPRRDQCSTTATYGSPQRAEGTVTSSTHSRTRCPWPLPFPLGCATLYTREGGWHATPGGTPRRPPPLPSCPRRPVRVEGARDAGHPPFLSHSRGRGAHDGTPPRLSTSPPAPALPSSCHPDASLPIGRATPSTRGTRVHAAPGSTRAEGVHTGTPRRTRGKGACDPRPHPSPFARKGVHAGTPLRSREQGLTRPSRVGQQDQRGLRAPVFTMPAPHFHAP